VRRSVAERESEAMRRKEEALVPARALYSHMRRWTSVSVAAGTVGGKQWWCHGSDQAVERHGLREKEKGTCLSVWWHRGVRWWRG
jgi:hypothetical protein